MSPHSPLQTLLALLELIMHLCSLYVFLRVLGLFWKRSIPQPSYKLQCK